MKKLRVLVLLIVVNNACAVLTPNERAQYQRILVAIDTNRPLNAVQKKAITKYADLLEQDRPAFDINQVVKTSAKAVPVQKVTSAPAQRPLTGAQKRAIAAQQRREAAAAAQRVQQAAPVQKAAPVKAAAPARRTVAAQKAVPAPAQRPLTGSQKRVIAAQQRREAAAAAQRVQQAAPVQKAAPARRTAAAQKAVPAQKSSARPLTGAQKRAIAAQEKREAAAQVRVQQEQENNNDLPLLNELSDNDLIGINDVVVRGYGPLPDTIVLDNYKHYMQPDIRTSAEGTFEPFGWHHDLGGRIERTKMIDGHTIKIMSKQTDPSGLYRFEWSVDKGLNKKLSTFFPFTWSRQMVQQKIVEAYNYARNHNYAPVAQRNNTFALVGFTKEGIEIKIIVNQKGRVITAFPEWPKK
jgi:hypothetical protein